MPIIKFSLSILSSFPQCQWFVEFDSSCDTVSLKYMVILSCLFFIVFENLTHLNDSSGYSSQSLVIVGEEQ